MADAEFIFALNGYTILIRFVLGHFLMDIARISVLIELTMTETMNQSNVDGPTQKNTITIEEHAKAMRTQGVDPWVRLSYTGTDGRGQGRESRRKESVGRGGKSWHSEAIALC